MQGTPEHADLGKVVERYLYDPYGRVTVLHGDADADDPVTEWHEDTGGSDWANEILFAGYRYDAETGLYHVRNRMYHPTLGRWMQRDPLGYVDGVNLYEYCSSAPACLADPFGQKVTVDVWKDKPDSHGTHGLDSASVREYRCGSVEETMERLMPGSDVVVDRDTGEVTIVRPPKSPDAATDSETRDKLEAAQRIYNAYRRMIADGKTAYVRPNNDRVARSTPYNPTAASDGRGSGSLVEWDPKYRPDVQRDQGQGRIERGESDPAEVFHHEMMHSDHDMQGTADHENVDPNSLIGGTGRPVVRPTPREEMRTIGVSGVRQGDSTEHDANKVLGNEPRASWRRF